jgi:uncharacterized membrane protein YkvA (DUF1232 family)
MMVGMGKSNPVEETGKRSLLDTLKRRARDLKVQTYALYLAYRDPRTPWFAKAWVFLVLAYALSPIDLIPDFIPFIGYLDDLILVPSGIALAIRLIPARVMAESRERAKFELEQTADGPARRVGRLGAVVIVLLWIIILAWMAVWILRLTNR